MAQVDQERREERRAIQAKTDARNSLSLEEKLAKIRASRVEKLAVLGSDGCLRDWANDRSSWGESSNRWASFVNWLITHGTPDDRHHLVTAMLWDNGLEIFHWIIRQPDTDIATAASIIWHGGASFHVPESAKASAGYTQDYQLEGYDLLLETADRIQGNYYAPAPGHRPIGFVPPYQMNLDRDRLEVRIAEDRLMIQGQSRPRRRKLCLLIGMMKSAAKEVAAMGIRVNTEYPAHVEWLMVRSLEEGMAPRSPDQVKTAMVSNTSL
ncbi:MAG: DUF4274 domain-containing protein [Aliishimia sp.]